MPAAVFYSASETAWEWTSPPSGRIEVTDALVGIRQDFIKWPSTTDMGK